MIVCAGFKACRFYRWFARFPELRAPREFGGPRSSRRMLRQIDRLKPPRIISRSREERIMASLKGTKTEKNVLTAFAGESQARNRYTYFAEAAKKEGFEQIARIFAETADQERAHAKRLFQFLEGGDVSIGAAYPAGVIGSTTDNLKAAAAGEDYEWQEMYPGFAKTAREEGFTAVAAVMEAIAVAEKQHAKRYLKLKANVDAGKVFKRAEKVLWRCINCGYLYEGTGAPETCPACGVDREYFELLGENW
jgi:rubrerythrin